MNFVNFVGVHKIKDSDFVFYDRYKQLCNKKGVSPSKAAIDAGISKSLVTKWKVNETKEPSPEVVRKLAEYFGISKYEVLEDFSPAQKEITPDLSEEDERDIARMLDSMLGQLGDSNAALMFDGEPVDEETRELLKISLENQFRLAKRMVQKEKANSSED